MQSKRDQAPARQVVPFTHIQASGPKSIPGHTTLSPPPPLPAPKTRGPVATGT